MTLRVPVDVNAARLKDWGRKVAKAVNQLANASSGGGGALADGDYGDIVVSSSGTAINFDSSVVTAFAKTFLDDANAAAVRTTLGVTGTGADTAYAFRANNLSDLANASTARTNLGLAIGTDVQAFDSDLGALASNSTNGLWARTGAGTGAARTITAGAGITVANGDGGSGNPTIAVAAFRGALVTKAADQTAANYTGGVMVGWDSEDYDTDTVHDNVTNNTRLTVPSGVTKVRLTACLHLSSVAATDVATMRIAKNGGLDDWTGAPSANREDNATSRRINLESPVITVTAGDYFEVQLSMSGDTSITVEAQTSWFAMEIVS